MTDDNPYRSPLSHGQVLRPQSWLRRGWVDAPGVVAAVFGILLLTVAIVGGVAMGFASEPEFRLRNVITVGGLYGIWSLVWFAAAQNYWKGNLWSTLTWTCFGLAPVWLIAYTWLRG